MSNVIDELGVNPSGVAPDADEEDLSVKIQKLEEKATNMEKAMHSERAEKKAYRAEVQALRRQVDELQNKKVEEDVFEGLEDDDSVPVATVKKLITETRMRDESRRIRENLVIGQRLARAAHPDFDEIVTQEVISDVDLRLQTDPDFRKQFEGVSALDFTEHVYQEMKKKSSPTKPVDKGAAQEPESEEEEEEGILIYPTRLGGPKTMDVKSSGPLKTSDEKLVRLSLDEKRKLVRQGKELPEINILM